MHFNFQKTKHINSQSYLRFLSGCLAECRYKWSLDWAVVFRQYNQMLKYIFYALGLFLLVLLHGSLLFCTDHAHCLVPIKQPPLSATHAYYLRTAIANFIPYPIKVVQGVAQYAIMIEVALLMWFIIKTIRRIVSLIFEVALLVLMALIAYKMFWFWKENPEAFYAKVAEYYSWGLSLLNQLWHMVDQPKAQPAQPQ